MSPTADKPPTPGFRQSSKPKVDCPGRQPVENSQSPAALDDLKVVELPMLDPLPFFAASMASKAMADLGAEVLKIEPPKDGAQDRLFGPVGRGGPELETRALHLFLDCNKLSVTLDFANPQGSELLMRILHGADVLFNPNPPALCD